jgi:4-hydroxy-tetrahydrodipicolinate synthase
VRPASWSGVHVALTTPFDAELRVDLAALAARTAWLLERGIDGVIVAGSLGEGSVLERRERASMIAALAPLVPDGVGLTAAIGAASTVAAVELARDAERSGARGLLVLPPYVYAGDAPEVREHVVDVLRATALPALLYNNPSAYGVDIPPEEVLEIAERCPALTGVKESSGDVRRITAIRALLGDRLEVAVGLDDALLEGIDAGATGWVAGLANALPDESIALYRSARAGDRPRARALYDWFLPLLRLDTRPKFVQLIKLVESEVGRGSTRVRPPRRELSEAERNEALAMIRERLAVRPRLDPSGDGSAATAR